jgi:hypothetical protein
MKKHKNNRQQTGKTRNEQQIKYDNKTTAPTHI